MALDKSWRHDRRYPLPTPVLYVTQEDDDSGWCDTRHPAGGGDLQKRKTGHRNLQYTPSRLARHAVQISSLVRGHLTACLPNCTFMQIKCTTTFMYVGIRHIVLLLAVTSYIHIDCRHWDLRLLSEYACSHLAQ